MPHVFTISNFSFIEIHVGLPDHVSDHLTMWAVGVVWNLNFLIEFKNFQFNSELDVTILTFFILDFFIFSCLFVWISDSIPT